MQTAQGEEEVSEEEYEEMSEEDYAYFEVRVIQADWEREREAILDLTRARAAVPAPENTGAHSSTSGARA